MGYQSDQERLKNLLDRKVLQFEQAGFIPLDPITIPHRFTQKQDIEIAGFFAAILAWGKRKLIINSCDRLLTLMDQAPYDFIVNHQEADLKPLDSFVHRTFNSTDLLYLIAFLKKHYQRFSTLEKAFSQFLQAKSTSVAPALTGFHDYVFSLPAVSLRTKKHIATPARNSACKRLNMFLRWMVRRGSSVDFGIWTTISPDLLCCPLDVHVGRTARQLGLLTRRQDDWKAVMELTLNLRQLDPHDPVKYDFALFGMGIKENLSDFF